ncbi:MAG: lytic transglycosylase domain-containing protein [Alphaproteobacteria bacterium]|nr:lytic transglycosylase domain-containing protein [Alphaproteobacteria bacterium]
MKNVTAKKRIASRLPKLATMAIVFWGLSSSSHLGAMPAWMFPADLPLRTATEEKGTLETRIKVLTPRDAALYRAAFAAQEKADWDFAEQAVSQTKDKRLAGHILADRYLRRGMTLAQAKEWFSYYSDLPEAADIYSMAKNIRGFSKVSIARPRMTEWQGINGFSSPASFRNINDNQQTPRAIAIKVNAALRRDDPAKAKAVLTAALNRGEVSITKAGALSSRIASVLFYNGETDQARAMARTAADAGVPQALWIDGLAAWKQHDFGTSAKRFSALASTNGLAPWNKAAAAYWAYRANSRNANKNAAYHWLVEAANYPQTFYGAMASQLIGRKIERSWKMPELTAANMSRLASNPYGWQALALAQVGRIDLAESSLRKLLSGSARDYQTAALALAEKAHMPSLILSLSGLTFSDKGKPFDAALYPVPPWQPAEGFKVDRALIYAIMSHESQFDPEAVSSKGACGLMQIMPATARVIDSEAFAKRPSNANCAHRLFDPTTNVGMGQKYVQVLSESPIIGNNLLFLLAAYNGGPGKLARWLVGADKSDPLLFIESLPVRQTRYYVQQVLLHYGMYRSRLAQSETAIAQLAHGEWPRFQLHDEPPLRAPKKVEMASATQAEINKTGR